MLRRGYDPSLAAGTICAAGTLGQIIPPSIVLVLLGEVLSSSYQQAQLSRGIFSPETVSVGDLFAGVLDGLADRQAGFKSANQQIDGLGEKRDELLLPAFPEKPDQKMRQADGAEQTNEGGGHDRYEAGDGE